MPGIPEKHHEPNLDIIVVNVYDDAIRVVAIEKEYKNYKVRRTITWIIVALLYLSLLAYPFLEL